MITFKTYKSSTKTIVYTDNVGTIQKYSVSMEYGELSIIVTADDVKYKIYGRPSAVRAQSKLILFQ